MSEEEPDVELGPFRWTEAVDACETQLRRRHGLQDHVFNSTRADELAGAQCIVQSHRGAREVVFVSKSFAEYTGFLVDDLIGRQGLHMLQPRASWQDELLNAAERQHQADFFRAAFQAKGCNNLPPPAVSLVVSCTASGSPYWCLLHAIAVPPPDGQDKSKYVLNVFTPLEAPVPTALWDRPPAGNVTSRTDVVRSLLKQARDAVNARKERENVVVLSQVAEWQCKRLAETLSDAYEGGHFVPRLGRESVDAFESLKRWETVFGAVEDELKTAWETTDEVYKSTYEDGAKAIACAIADPEGIDCPLVYISPGFEDLTGYRRTWALGRNCRFLQPKRPETAPPDANGGEVTRMREFCKNRKGSIINLLVNESASGELFWNLLFMEHVHIGQHYIFAVQTNIVAQKPLLDELVRSVWEDGPGIERLQRLRELFAAQEASFSPKRQSLLALSNHIIETWVCEVGQSVKNFWEGGHYVPKVGQKAVEEFLGRWPMLVDTAAGTIRKLFGLRDDVLGSMRSNDEGCIVCAVSDPLAVDCPLVFLSKGFEEMTGYKRDFGLGRNCRFLQPNTPGLNQSINGEEVQRMRAFCKLTGSAAEHKSIVNLLLNERRTGERFWNLLHMQHIKVEGRPYILGIQTILHMPMPTLLRSADVSDTMAGFDEVQFSGFVDQLRCFLDQLRPHLDQEGGKNMKTAEDSAHKSIVSFLKTSCSDYEGDHWVPLVGMDKAWFFQQDVTWKRVLDAVQNSLYKVWEISAGHEEEVACAVSDPTGEDCPLVYISREFEHLTGYTREWTLGRNCRFLQPNQTWRNKAFNEGECLQMRAFCKEPQQKGTRIINLLVNERRDKYPFWNLLVMEHITVVVPKRGANVGAETNRQRTETRPYIFGVQTTLDFEAPILNELLAMDSDGLKYLAKLRQILRSQEPSLHDQGLKSYARQCLDLWVSSLPGFFSLPRCRVALPAQWSRASLPGVGLEVTAQNMTDVVPQALEDGVRHFYLTFPYEERHKADRTMAELQARLLALRLADLLTSMQRSFLHYLRASIAFTLVTPPLFVETCSEIIKAAISHGYAIDVWMLDVRGLDVRNAVLVTKVAESWQSMSTSCKAGHVGMLGLCGAGPSIYEKVQAAPGGLPISSHMIEHYPGKLYADVKEKTFYEGIRLNGSGIVCYNVFGPRQRLLELDAFKEQAQKLNIDPQILLMKWIEAQKYGMVISKLPELGRQSSDPQSPSKGVDANGRSLRQSATEPHSALDKLPSEVQALLPDRKIAEANVHRTFARTLSRPLSGPCVEFFQTFDFASLAPEGSRLLARTGTAARRSSLGTSASSWLQHANSPVPQDIVKRSSTTVRRTSTVTEGIDHQISSPSRRRSNTTSRSSTLVFGPGGNLGSGREELVRASTLDPQDFSCLPGAAGLSPTRADSKPWTSEVSWRSGERTVRELWRS